MNFVDWLQLASVLLIVVTLTLNVFQLQEIGRQTRALAGSLRQIAYGGVSDITSDPRFLLFPRDPELLEWYLTSRGFKATNPAENKRRLYVMAKLLQHETNFINHELGHLSEESWSAWCSVLRADLQVAEFQEIWHASRAVYADSFAAFVDSILGERGHTPGSKAPVEPGPSRST